MGSISDTLQALERVMEYKRASYDICLAAARHLEAGPATVLRDIAARHDDHLRRIPVVFKHLDFKDAGSADETPLTEIRTGLFHDLGAGSTLDLVGAVIRVEEEALRLLRRPRDRAETPDLRAFLDEVLAMAAGNLEALRRIAGEPGR